MSTVTRLIIKKRKDKQLQPLNETKWQRIFVGFAFGLFTIFYALLIGLTVGMRYFVFWIFNRIFGFSKSSILDTFSKLWISTIVFTTINIILFVCRLVMLMVPFDAIRLDGIGQVEETTYSAVWHFILFFVGAISILFTSILSLCTTSIWEIVVAISISIITNVVSCAIAFIITRITTLKKTVRKFAIKIIGTINIGLIFISIMIYAITFTSPGVLHTIFQSVTLFVLTVLFTIEVPMIYFKVFFKEEDGKNEYYRGWSSPQAALDLLTVAFLQIYSVFAMSIYLNIKLGWTISNPFTTAGKSKKKKKKGKDGEYIELKETEEYCGGCKRDGGDGDGGESESEIIKKKVLLTNGFDGKKNEKNFTIKLAEPEIGV